MDKSDLEIDEDVIVEGAHTPPHEPILELTQDAVEVNKNIWYIVTLLSNLVLHHKQST